MGNIAGHNSIKKNSIANLVNRIWTTVANFLFVPIYIHYLGEEAYGLVTFFTTLQVVMNLLGLGLSKTLRREFAIDESSSEVILHKYKILRSVELIIWFVSIIIVTLCCTCADFIATKWINAETLSSQTISWTIRLMGVSIAGQLIANLYLGCLFGMQNQVLANAVQISWSIIKNVGAVFVVIFISTDVMTFYVWHAIIDVLYFIIVRLLVVSTLKQQIRLIWSVKDLSNLKTIYKFALGVLLISIGYALNSQIDKIIITKHFDLVSVGAYNSVYNLSILTTIIVSSVGIAVFPKFTQLFSSGNQEGLNNTFLYNNRLTVLFTSVIGAFLSVFSSEVLYLWTQSQAITDIMYGISFWLIMGTTLNALQEVPYNYFLACGCTKVNNIQTVIQIVYVLTITPLLIIKFGLKGAATAWFIEMFISTTLYIYVFCKMYLTEKPMAFIIKTYAPIVLFVIIAFFIRRGLLFLDTSIIIRLIVAVITGLGLILLSFYFSKKGIGNKIKI